MKSGTAGDYRAWITPTRAASDSVHFTGTTRLDIRAVGIVALVSGGGTARATEAGSLTR